MKRKKKPDEPQRTDMVEMLEDLFMQATVERSHHYVASVAQLAAIELKMLRRRRDVADEMLAELVDMIGTGSSLASIRQKAIDTKRELAGLPREVASTRRR